MNSFDEKNKYEQYNKPAWFPPSWVFGVVWPILYLLIAVSFGKVFWDFKDNKIPWSFVLPFVVNLIANVLYTYFQFGINSNALATIDIAIVFVSLVVILGQSFSTPGYEWVGWINVPYMAWVSFAVLLQSFVTLNN